MRLAQKDGQVGHVCYWDKQVVAYRHGVRVHSRRNDKVGPRGPLVVDSPPAS
jgi:hypothetical protein